MLKLLLAAAVACPRAVAINSKGAPSVEVKMNLFAKNNHGESCASDEGLSDIDQQLLFAANNGNDKIVDGRERARSVRTTKMPARAPLNEREACPSRLQFAPGRCRWRQVGFFGLV
jgi:hypothetical protein